MTAADGLHLRSLSPNATAAKAEVAIVKVMLAEAAAGGHELLFCGCGMCGHL